MATLSLNLAAKNLHNSDATFLLESWDKTPVVRLLAKLHEHELKFGFQGAIESRRTSQSTSSYNLLSKGVQQGSPKKGCKK